MIDVLYIYKHSQNDDQEMKYSLRSLDKYVNDVFRVFITGECPEFIDRSKVIFTPAKDIGAPMTNHWWKITETIKNTDIGFRFALMYDDIFFVNQTNLTNYPYYQCGLLINHKTGGEHYKQTLLNARTFLRNKTCGEPYNFELHTPFVYETCNFLYMSPYFEEKKDDCQSMAVRSVYGALFCEDSPYRGDIKIRGEEKVKDVVGVADCFSVSDDAFKYDTLSFLEQEFPNKSRWEI